MYFLVHWQKQRNLWRPRDQVIGLEAGILHGVIMFADFHTEDACHICFAASCSAGNKDVTVFRNVFAGCRTAD